MANLVITNTLAANTTIASAGLNTNFSDIKTWLNNRDNASDYWLNMKVLGTVANPAEIKSSAADCEFDIDCTGASGTPRVSWKRSGTTYFSFGVDGAASNLFKFGTTALTTNVAMQIPSTGVQVQFANGSTSFPSVTFLGDNDTGISGGGTNQLNLLCGGTVSCQFDADTTSSNTRMLVINASDGLSKRVSIGSSDSGGTGFRLLRIPN